MLNIVCSLKEKVQLIPQQEALLYLEDGEKETARLSFAELDQLARTIAAKLQEQDVKGQRILLLYPTGIEFLAALLACWYAKAIAVPVSCPKLEELNHHQAMLNGIADDADIYAVLSLKSYCSVLKATINKKVEIIASDNIDPNKANNYQSVKINNNDIAYLQYTSGSTSAPKAAIISHGNLIHSLKETIRAWHYTPDSVTLHWAPHTHVYGLVCGLLVPLYHGTPAIIMPPAAFIKKPLLWLSAISKYKVSHSGCPNFAYDLCIQHIKDGELNQLDLKSWKVAVNGGDMVQEQTLSAFVNKFRSCGFRLSYFCSAYGMSEVSGLIASTPFKRNPQVLETQKDDKSGQPTPYQRVSSGQFIKGLEAIVVDPETKQLLAEGETGEIWLAGQSVAQGYWRRPEESEAVFNAKISTGKQHYFRTGDLGLILNKSLYLTGRLKEVMIIYGKKYYPLDFEITVSKAIKTFQINLPQVVFSSGIGGKEKIIVVQELAESVDQSIQTKLIDTIHHAIRKAHGIDVTVLFSPKAKLPKTASGKLQRKKAQLLYENNELTVLRAEPINQPKGDKTDSQALFISLIAKVLNIDEQDIDLDVPLSRYSFDSINILQLTTAINDSYQLSLSPATLYDYSSLAAFYDFLSTNDNVKTAHSEQLQTSDSSRDIAIIGMSGLFPQSPDLDSFWNNLSQGNDCISEVPQSRWDWHDLTVKWGGFIEGIENFDAAFFNISPREAELIDPQQRLFLQTVWKTIEDAGYSPEAIASLKTGLYVGVFNHDYAELLQQNEIMDAYLTTGTMNSMIANRISYFLNLRGPSETIDTACSSSLVAMHQAVHGILNDDCDIAIAGGVNALISPSSFISANQAGMLSPDGRCKTFDKEANGYVRGEGVGALLLKRLSRAIEDGDHIYGVIKGSAVNHGGHVTSLTAPNPNAQAEVISTACHRAQVSIDSIQYIEAHGTGTPLGDPIEINGLKKAFQQLAKEQGISELTKQSCGIGTVKSQIGHLESAAGIAGMIKILLALQHELLPSNLNFNSLNPYIELENSPFYIVDQAKNWPKGGTKSPRRAGISSFGFGGANAHLIIEESPVNASVKATYTQPYHLITLSAKTKNALQQRTIDLLQWLDTRNQEPNIAALSYTLNTGRQHFEHRFCVIVASTSELKQQLHAAITAQPIKQPKLTPSTINFNELRRDYLQGKAIDWAIIYDNYQQRIPLPSYPFAKTPYWLTVKQLVTANKQTSLGYYQPVWIETDLSEMDDPLSGSMLIVGQNKDLNQRIQSQFKSSQLINIEDASTFRLDTAADYVLLVLNECQNDIVSEKDITQNLQQSFNLVHKIISDLIELKSAHPVKLIIINQKPSPFSRALVGLAKSLHQEQQSISCRIIELNDLSLLPQELSQKEIQVRYDEDKKRHILHYEEQHRSHSERLPSPLKKAGVYLITGGMGGLGYLFASYLAERYQAKLILTGRTAASDKHHQAIKALEKKGGTAVYIQADVSCKKEVQNLIQASKKQFREINGVIHAAGITKDQLIAKQNPQDMAGVLAPKISGSLFLDAATTKEPLDFFILCSSISPVFGNRGQSDYAYANAFQDEFALMRQHKKDQGLCSGQTISVNWPLWQEGGLTIAPEYQQLLEQTLGIVSLSTQEGMQAFEYSLQQMHPNLIVLPGNQEKLNQELQNKNQLHFSLKTESNVHHAKQLKNATETFIRQIIAETLKIASNSIDKNQPFEQYGIDSLMIIQLNQRLEKEFSNLPKTLFFEYQTLASLSEFFIENYSSSLKHLLADELTLTLDEPGKEEAISQQLKQQTHSPSIESKNIKQATTEAIAIIGVQGIFPQSDNLDSFWQHLIDEDDLVTEVPDHRWKWQDYYGDGADQTHCKWGGFINNFDCFDSGFFNISTREANLMDPQQRLFLETTWKTIEDAGYNPFDLSSSKVGVFAGVGFSEYQSLITSQQKIYHGLVATGNSHSLIANRVSYFFNFRGPSEAIDTACSSSLVAINRAVQALRQGECELAIAGGVSIILNPETVVITSQLGALSSDGRCKSFDKSANGFVKGEGVATVLLKPLTKAQSDGDHIYAVIRASAVNHGGKALSLTAPNVKAQSELLLNAYRQSDIKPETISYIETHGTGTSLGDPVEIDSLKLAFNTLLTSKNNGCHIGLGSVKTNIGHLEPAAGIAGVTKLILSMKHEKLPGLVHFKELNPYIQLNDSPFYIVDKAQKWNRIKDSSGNEIPLRAGISSFGFGGTNAHLVLEEGRPYQEPVEHLAAKPYYLITLSAKQQQSLQQKIVDLHQWISSKNEALSLASLSFTLNAGRAHFAHRCALVVDSIESLKNSLAALSNNELPDYSIRNNGQNYQMQGPVFDEIYQISLAALEQVQNVKSYRDKLFMLADLYTKHYPIEWQKLYQGESLQRIASLPAYPFIKQRHWYDMTLAPTDTLTNQVTATKTDLAGLLMAYLQQLFAEKLQIPAAQIHGDETYEVYGVDSVIGIEITKQLINDFGDMPKTILYERNRLNQLSQYLLQNHNEQLSKRLGQTATSAALTHNDTAATVPEQKPPQSQDIAIIGINVQFPMANTMDEFWQNLITGRDCVSTVPKDRWNYQDYPVVIGGEEKVFPHGGFITDVDKFDPLFFNISPRDAALMDPQERLFMQSVWSTLEDAGYSREKLKQKSNGSVGVFAGMTYNSYPLFIAEEWHKGNRIPLNIQSFSIANRVSYFLDLHGPSFVVDTACSSSLAAIHLACESMIRGNCAMAIAGGVNLSLHPSKYHFLGSYNFMSEQGRCTSFAENGSGYVPSEGLGSVLLKPLTQAIADGDHIYGVIKGSSMNHGGKTSGYTVPNPNAQAQVILQALKSADVDARTISYIEAHGTGTSLGDPIEVRGLQEAFECYTKDKQFCAIGSVKSNIGHLEAAAGMPQIAKVLLQMRHKQLVPTIHTEHLNPIIDFKNAPFYVQQHLSEWQSDNQIPLRAGISSFGAGGVNVHLIIEAHQPAIKQTSKPSAPYLFILSALNEERLCAYVERMRNYIATHIETIDDTWLRDSCYTLQTGRESMSARLALLVETKEELLAALNAYPNKQDHNLLINPQTVNTGTLTAVAGASMETLAKNWVDGATVDWAQAYDKQQANIIALPTYPFAKRSCWITTQKTQSKAAPEPLDLASLKSPTPDSSDEWLYKTIWEKNPLTTQEITTSSEGKWLIFSDKESGLVLQQTLNPQNCIYCFTAERYQKLNQQVYYINPGQKADYQQLLQQIHAEHGDDLKGIIYLCNALNDDENKHYDPSLSLLYTFKSLIEQSWKQPLIFSLLSHSSQQLHPFESMNIWQHHLWSMTRIFAAEQGNFQVLLLDLDEQQDLQENAQILVNELSHINPNQNHIAYRGNERYTLRIKADDTQSPDNWKPPHAALITGGLGALGYEVAQYLVGQGCQKLLLTGTTAESALSEEKTNWLRKLEEKGAKVHYAAVDVADKQQMERLIKECEQSWGRPIDGVFHLAGITTDNITLADMDEALWRKVLNVKIKGALVLHELFSQAQLSSFVLFSSISAVPHFGIAGLSAYAAANEFINGLALYRRSQQLPAISINWVAWSEKGMSHRYNHDAVLRAFGIDSVSVNEGMKLLDKILHLNPAEITVCRINWKKFLQVNRTLKANDFFSHVVSEHPPLNTTTLPITLSEDAVENLVLEQFEQVLGLERDEINKNLSFEHYGMDSIIGISFTEALNKHFPEMISPMDLYRYPSLEQLINFLMMQVNSNKQPAFAEDKQISQEQDLDALDYEQLNQLLGEELKELELEYD